MAHNEAGHKISPRDFFLHLGIIVALYITAISLIALLFQVVDISFPDRLNSYIDPYSTGIRLALASLIIFFPVYILLGWFYQKDVAENPEKRNLGVRRWLVYITLFVTGLTIIIDLVMLLNSFLGGEITTRFILKVVVVLVVAGIIFAYYILSLRAKAASKNIFRTFATVAIILVLFALVVGFMVLGSPITQRKIRFDITRTQNLQEIQREVVFHWQQTEKMPQTLAELGDSIRGYVVPVDPETGEPYTYRVTGAMSFEVCAEFALPSSESERFDRSYAYPEFPVSQDYWKHEAGRKCFSQTINPELYPPNPIPVKPISGVVRPM